MVGSYYGSLSCADLRKKSQLTRRYGEQYMDITTESFCRSGLERSDIATSSKGQRYLVWVVPAPFCAMQYISDPLYLPGDEKSVETRSQRLTDANVEFSAAAMKCRKNYRM